MEITRAGRALILVLQGAPLQDAQLSGLAALVGAGRIVTLGRNAWRMTGATDNARLEPACRDLGLDYAWIPANRSLSGIRLLAIDMDSTLITTESIDEMGAAIGIRDRVALITEQAMRGEINYPESLRRRTAQLAGLGEDTLERILAERVHLSPGAETLLLRCRQAGIRTLLASGGPSFFADRLQARLGIDYALSNTLEIVSGRLTGRVSGDIVDGAAKAARLVHIRNLIGASREQVLAVGDGANDIDMMAEAGVSVAFRARSVVREHATHVLEHCGLDGVLNLFV